MGKGKGNTGKDKVWNCSNILAQYDVAEYKDPYNDLHKAYVMAHIITPIMHNYHHNTLHIDFHNEHK
jgi:hypothetical protein